MQNEFQCSVLLVFLWKTWLDATHGTEKSAFRWKYYEMHDMVQSQSFNGDSKVLHYMVEWKDSMHIGFYVQLSWFAWESSLYLNLNLNGGSGGWGGKSHKNSAEKWSVLFSGKILRPVWVTTVNNDVLDLHSNFFKASLSVLQSRIN